MICGVCALAIAYEPNDIKNIGFISHNTLHSMKNKREKEREEKKKKCTDEDGSVCVCDNERFWQNLNIRIDTSATWQKHIIALLLPL